MAHDLVLKGGHVIDPASGHDGPADVAFADGRLAAVGPDLEGRETHDVSGCLVTPGLIDLHTHVYWGATSLSVEADTYARRAGATTLVDAGSAGPGTFAGFRRHVIAPAEPRILAYLHISFAGIYAFSPTIMVGESQDIRLMATREAVEVAEANRDLIIGIKVRVGRLTSGVNGIVPLELALEVADRTGLPVMAHIDEPAPTYESVVDLLRPGDVLTHCFRPFPNAPTRADGSVKPALVRARERGVLFDIGHGMGAFAWDSAEAMVAAGFAPDTISSDVHVLCIDGPAFDLLHTMTKLLALGMPLTDVVAAATLTPARAIRRDDLGRLAPGGPGEASVIELEHGAVDLVDVLGKTRRHDRRFTPRGRVIAGRYLEAVS
jgi:dihydroorotase